MMFQNGSPGYLVKNNEVTQSTPLDSRTSHSANPGSDDLSDNTTEVQCDFETDPDQALRFLRVLYGRCGGDLTLALTAITELEQGCGFGEDRQVKTEKHVHTEFRSAGSLRGVAARACDLAAERRDVYIRVCPVAGAPEKGRGDADISAELKALFIDLDIGDDEDLPKTREEGLELLEQIVPVEPTIVVNSGNGLHCYFVLEGPVTGLEAMEQVERQWQQFVQSKAQAKGYKLDSVFDLARILRVPGTFNYKAEPKPVELLECHPERVYRIDQLIPADFEVEQVTSEPDNTSAEHVEYSDEQNIQTLRDVLPRIPEDLFDDYETWLEIGMAIHSVLPDEEGLAMWRERSMSSDKYEDGCCDRKWRSFRQRPDGVGIGTLVRYAQPRNTRRLRISNGQSIEVATGDAKLISGGNSRPESAPPLADGDQAEQNGDASGVVILDPKSPMVTARLLVEQEFTCDGVRTLHYYRGDFYRWTGSHYRRLEPSEVRAAAYQFAETAIQVSLDSKGREVAEPFNPTKSKVENVMDALPAVVGLPPTIDAPCWLDERPGDPEPSWLFAMGNGLFDLETGVLYPHTPRFFSFNAVDYAYDAAAGVPKKWLDFLDQLWPNDPEAIRALQQWMGYCLTHATDLQKILLMIGPKRSGKGTIGRVLTALLGQANVAGPTLKSLDSNFGLAALIGKPLAIIGDARLSGRADVAAITERLLSISGEDGQTIDRKYKDAWTGRLPTRFMIITNELPRLTDASGAVPSRFVILTLTRTFYGHENRKLTEELLKELPAIFNWAVHGWRDLKATGHFTEPASSAEATADLEALGSPVSAFLDECCVLGEHCRVETADLFEAWRAWCEGSGQHASTRQVFGGRLRAAVPTISQSDRREGERRFREWNGIALDPDRLPRSATRGNALFR